jgi:2-desacetyl-2-hydroxyethyl bacteriochlorophyllide A dehydrogenase
MQGRMRAAVVEKPFVIKVKEVKIPEINDEEVLIKVKAAGICGTDSSIYTGKYSSDKLPLITGHEFSGIAVEVGKKVKGIKIGDRVTVDINNSCGNCFYCNAGNICMCQDFNQIGIHIDGAFAEYVKGNWMKVHKLPDNLSFEQGAFVEPLSCVVHASKALNFRIGSSVAIIGCGLGILHAALAKLRGAAPVIVVGDNKKRLDIASSMGADYVLNINDNLDPVKEVKKITGGRGPDYVLEAVGNPVTYEQALNMVRPGGTIGAFGITGFDDTIKVRPYDLVLGEKRIIGCCAGVGTDWDDAIVLLEHKRITAEKMFSMIVPLEELENAIKQIRIDPNLVKVLVSPEINKKNIF